MQIARIVPSSCSWTLGGTSSAFGFSSSNSDQLNMSATSSTSLSHVYTNSSYLLIAQELKTELLLRELTNQSYLLLFLPHLCHVHSLKSASFYHAYVHFYFYYISNVHERLQLTTHSNDNRKSLYKQHSHFTVPESSLGLFLYSIYLSVQSACNTKYVSDFVRNQTVNPPSTKTGRSTGCLAISSD